MTDSKPSSDIEESQDDKWHDRTRYQILLFTVVIALFGLVLGLILDWYIDPQSSTQKKDLVQALGLITAGVAGAVGIYFTWRGQERNQRNTQEQFRLTRQSQEQNQKSTQAQLENAQEELRLTRQGQITERFTRAIDQLGSEKLEIRLGGIYALERIDKESPERAYHGTVMEVLTAYVRENSRQDHEKPSTPTSGSDEDAELDKGVEQDKAPPVRKPPTDLQAILDVLKRRAVDRVPWQHRVHLDLREANLHGANLHGANLHGADLQGAYLREANLQVANLQGANFQGADLQGADLWEANLQGADLQEANLQGGNLREANLQGADLWEANLQGAYLREANLQATDLQRANLQEAHLKDANLQGGNLREANLQGADLWEANLQATDLQGANLQEADLHGADLEAADLEAADLEAADHITQDQIESTIGSSETKLPEGLNHPELWSKSPGEQMDILQERINEEQMNVLLGRLSRAEESDSGK